MYNNILVPVEPEQDEAARRILNRARALAENGGRITILNVIPEMPSYVETYIPRELHDMRARDQRELLQALASDCHLPDAVILVRTGTPHHMILDEISAQGSDLVVVGSHRPDFSDFFLGSTAARVVRHAPCSVLVDR